MNTSSRIPADSPTLGNSPENPVPLSPPASAPRDYLVSGPGLFLAVGVIAGGLAGLLVDGIHDRVFPLSPQVARLYDQAAVPPDDRAVLNAAELRRNYWRTALAVGLFGAITGASLAGAEGVARRSGRTAVFGLLAGAVLGGAFGAIGGYTGVLTYQQFDAHVDTMNWMTATHGAYWGIAAIGIGLSFGPVTRNWKLAGHCAAFAVAAGILSALIYPVVAGYVFPAEESDKTIPDSTWSRLAWTTISSGLVGLIVSAGAKPSSRAAAEPPKS